MTNYSYLEASKNGAKASRVINSFTYEYFFLSNFFEEKVTYDGITYCNNEAAFQAQKCESYEDRKRFADLNPSNAKKLGRRVKLRPDWEDVKYDIMKDIVHEKFSQHQYLANLLVSTGDSYLEEGNNWNDKTWGTVKGEGLNYLGKILMDEREIQRKLMER